MSRDPRSGLLRELVGDLVASCGLRDAAGAQRRAHKSVIEHPNYSDPNTAQTEATLEK